MTKKAMCGICGKVGDIDLIIKGVCCKKTNYKLREMNNLFQIDFFMAWVLDLSPYQIINMVEFIRDEVTFDV